MDMYDRLDDQHSGWLDDVEANADREADIIERQYQDGYMSDFDRDCELRRIGEEVRDAANMGGGDNAKA
jgi:hypothetical protein